MIKVIIGNEVSPGVYSASGEIIAKTGKTEVTGKAEVLLKKNGDNAQLYLDSNIKTSILMDKEVLYYTPFSFPCAFKIGEEIEFTGVHFNLKK